MLGINQFATRQTKDSPYSYYAGSNDELIQLVIANWDKKTSVGREGVVLVTVPAQNFFSGVVKIDENTPLIALFAARREGEMPYIQTRATGEKQPAKFVEIVCYHKDTLKEQATTGEDWEIVSINARLTENEPMHPVTMARNLLGLPGGSPATYTAQQIAEAVIYWSQHCMTQ